MAVLRCRVSRAGDLMTWTSNDGAIVATRRDGERPIDIRPSPPYYEIQPCPYCDADGSAHDPVKHVDPSLGAKVAPKEPTR